MKVRFGSLEARTAFYKSRTRLGPNSTVWVNEDLTRANEVLAYQARKLALHKYLSRTWTYFGQVYIQKTEDAEPDRVNRKEDLPHYEILDQITTPLRSQGRFAANKNLNATVRLSQVDKQNAPVPANPDHQGDETSMNVPPDRPTDTSPSMDTSLNGRPTKPTESMIPVSLPDNQTKALDLSK